MYRKAGVPVHLAIVIIILIVWAVILIKEKFTPPAPPIDDLDAHIKTLSSMNTQKERQKYLKNMAKGDKKCEDITEKNTDKSSD